MRWSHWSEVFKFITNKDDNSNYKLQWCNQINEINNCIQVANLILFGEVLVCSQDFSLQDLSLQDQDSSLQDQDLEIRVSRPRLGSQELQHWAIVI